jgi:hypothetical protein
VGKIVVDSDGTNKYIRMGKCLSQINEPNVCD